MRQIISIVILAAVLWAAPARAQDNGVAPAAAVVEDEAAKLAREEGTVTGMVKTSQNLTTLAHLLVLTKLDEDLADPPANEKGRYSLFAPTDEAFKKLPQSIIDDLVKPENAEKLRNIIGHHIVVGKFTILPFPQNVLARDGQRVSVTDTAKGYKFGTALADKNAISTSNGVIYLIDTVQLPEE